MLLNKKMITNYFVIIFFIFLDRFFKNYAVFHPELKIPILRDILSFSFVKNYFIAFSLPFSGLILEAVIFVLIGVMIFLFFSIKQKNDITRLFIFSVIIGSLSNFYDRLKYGFVVDYIDLRYFTVFNIADVLISVGVFLYLVKSLRRVDKNE